MSSSDSQQKQIARATNLVAGMQKHLANQSSFSFASQAFTPAQITAASQQLVALYADSNAAKSVVKAKIAAERSQTPALNGLLANFASYVRVTYSESPDVLADFGLTPKKVATPLTAEEKAVAAVRRASTRQARGITTAKVKKSIKGSVVNAVLVPVTTEPVVSTSPTATSAPANGSATSASASKGG